MKENPFEKEVNYYHPVKEKKEEPIKTVKDVNKWKEDSNAYLKENKIPKRVIDLNSKDKVYNSLFHNFLIIWFIVFLIGFMIFTSWGIYNNKFKSELNNSLTNICEAPVVLNSINFTCPVCNMNCPNIYVNLTCNNLNVVNITNVNSS